ncbi:uncharacterized protein LOC116614921 [Nematostella vectensis]|uniref:uncharacterized protein LOC116614921 n=1 Tax=Nematostella vectensis TaxID=45351 RepID=UPI0013905AC8|nr:uncharacterized protein LOC116614921 [Nematostella vectensis]
MKWSKLCISLGILCVCLTKYTQECSPPKGWQPMTPSERAKKAQIVVYGTVVASPRTRIKGNNGQKTAGRYTAEFRLHCIIKGPRLKALVNITGFGDFPGVCVHSTAKLNKTYVVFVEHSYDTGVLRVDEINVQRASVHVGQAHKIDKLAVLREIMFESGRNASVPLDASSDVKSGCPSFPTTSVSRYPARKDDKHDKACRCRKKKQKQRKKKKRLKKVKTLATSKEWLEQPTLPRTRRYNNANTALEGNVEVLVQISGNEDFMKLGGAAPRLSHFGYCWRIMLTLHCVIITQIMWLNT